MITGLVATGVLATSSATPVGASGATVDLGTAATYAVFAGTTITNTGPSVLGGDLGVSPGSAITGFPPGILQDGTEHAADGPAAQAAVDLTSAIADIAGRSTSTPVADIGNQTLTAGTYSASSSMAITGNITLDAMGDPGAIFIFKATSSLTTATGVTVSLANGAQACNIFWDVGSSATLGSGSNLSGTILTAASATLATGAVVHGRVLALAGAVTLDSNTITPTTCASATVTYDSQGGSTVHSDSGLAGSTINEAAGPSLAGYGFAGWNTAVDGSGVSSAAGAPMVLDGDVTLYAQWTPNATSTVRYDSRGGAAVAPVALLSGTTILIAPDPTRPGYRFTGWNTAPDGTGTAVAAGSSVTLAGDITLNAQWVRLPFGGSFDCATATLHMINGQLTRTDLHTGRTTPIGGVASPVINAIGYDSLDGFVYGRQVIKGHVTIIRIGSDGTITVVGRPVGFVGSPGFTYNSADMDATGNLVLRVTPSQLLLVNVSTLSERFEPLIDASGNSTTVSGFDLVRVGDSFYSLQGDQLFAIKESTGVVTSFKVSGATKKGTVYGAGFTDAAGELFFSANRFGQIIQVEPDGRGAYRAVASSSGPPSTVNDGASCPGAWNPGDVPTVINHNFATPFDSTLRKAAASGVLSGSVGPGLMAKVTSEPAHGVVALNVDGSFTYQPQLGFVGDVTFSFAATDGLGSLTAPRTVTISVQPPV